MTGRNGHWGALSCSEDINETLANILIQNSLKQAPVTFYQPSDYPEPSPERLPPECSTMDETVLHTIKLLQYAKKMQMIIDKIKDKEDPKDIQLQPPVFPEQPEKKLIHTTSYPFGFMSKVLTPFVEGRGTLAPRLTETNAKQILRKCVATLFAHLGYDDTTEDVLDIMTDISEKYFEKIVSLLRVASDFESLSGNVGFPDVIERVYHELGIGSVISMHFFYQGRILLYHQKTLTHCRKLAADYANLIAPDTKPEVVGEVVKCKVENEEVEEYVEVPEIHFPALSEGLHAEELQPSLEHGYQMLHNLEQEEQLHNLGADDDEITVVATRNWCSENDHL